MRKLPVVSVIANILLVGYILINLATTNSNNYQWKAEECLKGWTNSLYSLRDTVDIVFLGNSITYGGLFEAEFSDKRICNLGYPSDDLCGMTERINQIIALHPAKVFLMGGINGLTNQDLNDFENEYETLVKSLKDSMPLTVIYLQSILPVNKAIKNINVPSCQKIIEANGIIEQIGRKYECRYINLHSLYAEDNILPNRYTADGVHLLPDAYKIWFQVIKDYVYE